MHHSGLHGVISTYSSHHLVVPFLLFVVRTEFVYKVSFVCMRVYNFLCVFSTSRRGNDDVLLNNCVPYLVRSKAIDSTECGISEGGGMLDSLTLLSSDEYKEKVVLH